MSSTVRIRFERSLAEIPDSFLTQLKVPYEFSVKVKRPIGLHVVEGPGKSVNVQYIKPEGGAARARRVEIGDQIIEMSASWGDRMWEVNSVESFVVGVKMDVRHPHIQDPPDGASRRVHRSSFNKEI